METHISSHWTPTEGGEAMSYNKILSWCLVFVLVLFVTTRLGAAEPRTMTAVRIENPPKIDGELDDPCWKLAVPTSGFIQMAPEEGKLATEQTRIRVLYDEDNLYFGIECLDSRPQKIVSRLVPRDSNFWPGDLVSIVLDTFHDHQTCYVFQVNPRGVQRDLRFSEDGGRGDSAWDGLWWSAAEITDRGWTVEVAIPFKSLGFSRENEQIWGVNVQRFQGSKQEDSNWSFIRRSDISFAQVSRAGDLLGLSDIKPGLHLELLPYGMTKYTQDLEKDEGSGRRDVGLDIKYGITSNLTLDVTFNPDFGQIEADEERINLTRFELFYREKRPFFMERSELFTPMNLFYSRRIADPSFGAKLTGKIGDYSFGLLTCVDEERGPDPTYVVFRLQKDLPQNSSMGIIGVGKQKGEDQYSRAFGIDLSLRPGRNTINLDLAKSFQPGLRKDDWRASILFIGQFGDRFSMRSEFEDIQPEFNVDQIGYIPHDPHVGQKRFDSLANYRFEIGKFGVRWVTLGQRIHATKWTDDPRWGWDWSNASIILSLKNHDWIILEHRDWYLRWRQKGYRGETLGLSYDMRGKAFIRRLIVRGWTEDNYDWGDDYFGEIRAVSVLGEMRPRDNLSLDFDGNVIWEYLPSGKLDEIRKVGNVRVTYFPTRRIFLRVFAPLNPSLHRYAINALLSYAYSPMSRFYLAYNEQRSKNMKLTDRIIMAKLSYLWNL
nr:hypothetical protein [Desulfobacterales bacterium]